MKIEVKKVQFGPERSHEETLNFVCEVYADGLKIGYARNNGCGGSTHITAQDCEQMVRLDAAEKWALRQPKLKFPAEWGGGEYEASLDGIVDDLVDSIYNAKQETKALAAMNKKMPTHIFFGKPGDLNTYTHIKFSWDIKNAVCVLKHPKAIAVVKATLEQEIPKLAPGEEVLNDYLQDLVSEVKISLLSTKN